MQHDESTQTPERVGEASTSNSAGRTSDPVARALGFGILIAVLLALSAVAYVLYAGLLGTRAPRTAVERQVQVLEQYTAENPTSAYGWADYLKALTLTEQYVKAEQVLDEIDPMIEEEPLLMIEKARLQIATGESEQALDGLDEAIALAQRLREERLSGLAGSGVSGMVTDPFGEWIANAAILQVGVYQEASDWAMVVEASTVALEENPTMADMLTVRGFAYVELGDVTAAEADFRAALEMVPGDEDALRGLKSIGAEAGGSGE